MLRDWWFARMLAPLARHEADALRAYANAAWPARGEAAAQAQFLVLDFELDGLGEAAHLLQAGWVKMDNQSIALGTARRFDIRSDRRLDDKAVTIHGIGEDRAREGEPLSNVARALLPDMNGRVLVAHGAAIEESALGRMAKAVWQVSIPLRTICTMALDRRLHPDLGGSDAYRLARCRARYNLPDFDAHDALGDAIATGELFLAQLAHMPADTRLATLEDCRFSH